MTNLAAKINHNRLSWLALIAGVLLTVLAVITNSPDIDKLSTKVLNLGLFYAGFSVYLHFWRGSNYDVDAKISNDRAGGDALFACAIVIGTALVVAFS